MAKRSFYRYLEMAQDKENIVIEKIDEILNFKDKIKDNKIIKESFTFLHYPEGSEFNPTTYTSDESVMTGIYVPNLIELKKIIADQNLYSSNNSITYSIEYLDKDAVINKNFSTEKYSSEREWGKEDELKIVSSSEIKKKTSEGEKYEKNSATFSSSELKY
jgi:hypothetical protein